MTHTELTYVLETALEAFRYNGTMPNDIDLGQGRIVRFEEEPVDDDFLGVTCLRNPSGEGLQVHEYVNGRSLWEGVNEDYETGGWLVQKDDDAMMLAHEIISDFEHPEIFGS